MPELRTICATIKLNFHKTNADRLNVAHFHENLFFRYENISTFLVNTTLSPTFSEAM